MYTDCLYPKHYPINSFFGRGIIKPQVKPLARLPMYRTWNLLLASEDNEIDLHHWETTLFNTDSSIPALILPTFKQFVLVSKECFLIYVHPCPNHYYYYYYSILMQIWNLFCLYVCVYIPLLMRTKPIAPSSYKCVEQKSRCLFPSICCFSINTKYSTWFGHLILLYVIISIIICCLIKHLKCHTITSAITIEIVPTKSQSFDIKCGSEICTSCVKSMSWG